MKTAQLFSLIFCLSFICAFAVPQASADEWNKKTVVTFSGPVSVAGNQLDAGTYVFKLADDDADRHIVQIFNQDETHVIATILAIPDYRLTPTGSTVIKFSETSDGSTQSGTLSAEGVPIKEWFYPGDNFGQEFKVRPQAASTEAVAEATPAPTSESAEPAEAPSSESAAPAEPESSSAQAEPQSQPSENAQPQSQEPAPAEAAPAAKPLPKTASPVPLIALLSGLALAASGCLFLARKRIG